MDEAKKQKQILLRQNIDRIIASAVSEVTRAIETAAIVMMEKDSDKTEPLVSSSSSSSSSATTTSTDNDESVMAAIRQEKEAGSKTNPVKFEKDVKDEKHHIQSAPPPPPIIRQPPPLIPTTRIAGKPGSLIPEHNKTTYRSVAGWIPTSAEIEESNARNTVKNAMRKDELGPVSLSVLMQQQANLRSRDKPKKGSRVVQGSAPIFAGTIKAHPMAQASRRK
jgi:hypothetical protein